MAGGSAYAQKLKKEDKLLLSNLQQHVQYLADDALEGRRTGTAGEQKASEYISALFGKLGLQPKGTHGFFQPFEVSEGRVIGEETSLLIDGKSLQPGKDYFPLAYSASASVEAQPSLALQEPGSPWFLDLKEVMEAAAQNPHADLGELVMNKVKELQKKGATAVFLYNTSGVADGLKFNGRDRTAPLGIPVVYLQKAAADKLLADHSATLDIRMRTSVQEKKRSGRNVVAYLDHGAANTVVIGAHFDHLGMGEDGNSREVEKKGIIHNGADDNASGTAALIELARMLKETKASLNNYLFIAFSGEELGLYGSKHFTENPTIDLGKVNYMINMDMIGRLSDSSRTVTVGGFGTSPTWASLFEKKGKKALYAGKLQFRFDSSGTGPSDHTSFYLKNIPVLFYFTGLHSDYHKPTDDFDKINYTGQMDVVKHIFSLVLAQPGINKLAFTKTREAQTTTSARFTVSLGIMPDYTFSGAGVRVDGVSENKPAQKAGLKAGDIITRLGEHPISSMEGYMQALSKFKKGDKATVTYTRGAETLNAPVEF